MTLIFWIVHKQYKIFFLSFISHAWGYINRTPGSNLIVNVHYIDSGEFDKINETKFIVKIHLIHRWCPNAWLALAWASIWLLLRADQLGWPCQTKLCQPRLVRPVSAGSAYPDWSPPALPRSPAYEMRAAGEDYPEKNSDSSIIQRIKKKMYYQKNRRPKPRPKENENGEFRRWTARILPISERVLLEVLPRCKYFPRRRRLLSLRRPSTSLTGFPPRCIGSPECFVPYAWLRTGRFISARYDLPIAARRRSANQCLLPVMYATAVRSSPAGRNSV
jgi:hypothetical protein